MYLALHMEYQLKRKEWTDQEKSYIKTFYISLGAAHCASKLERGMSSIYHQAERLGVKKPRKKFDIEAFNNIDSKEVAYILGLIWADGHIRPNHTSVGLTLVSEDMKEVLKYILQTGEWGCHTAPIRERASKEAMTLRCCNREVWTRFKDLDYVDKSVMAPLKVLRAIPDNLKHYWWRGYFDGDGNLFVSSQKTRYGILTLSSSFDQDWKAHKTLCTELQINFGISKTEDKRKYRSSRLFITNIKGIETFMHYIYNGYEREKIGLTRKWAKWQEFLSKEPRPKTSKYIGVAKRPDGSWRAIYKRHEMYATTEEDAYLKRLLMEKKYA